jgi:hypothetical protein
MADASTESTALQFVKLCLSARWDAGALAAACSLAAQRDYDWGAVWHVARNGGVAPLLYHATRGLGLLPATVEGALRQAYYRNAGRNLILLHSLEIVLRRLAAEGVPVIVLKGAALAQGVYSRPGLRPMCDLDLLVRREDLPLTRRVLSSLGYETDRSGLRDGFTETYHHAVMLIQRGGAGADLDVHWSLFGSIYFYYRVPMDWFWQTALPIRFGAAPARMLGPEAQVLHLCAHIVRHGGCDEAELRSFHDVAEVLSFYGEQLDWDQLLDKAQSYSLLLAVRQVLSRLHQEWKTPLPDSVADRLRALRPSRDERRAFSQLPTAGRAALGYWRDFLSIPDWRLRLGFARCVLFPAADYMQRRYRNAPRWLLPLYYPRRWLGILRRVPRRT